MEENKSSIVRAPITYEACKVGYFLARYGTSDIDGSEGTKKKRDRPPEILGTYVWKSACLLFYNALGEQRDPDAFYHSLKNIRDRFDAHIPGSSRRGWRRTYSNQSPGDLPALYRQVIQEAETQTESDIY